MTNTIYFAANTRAAFTSTSTANVESTHAGSYDPAFVPNSIHLVDNYPDYIESWAYSISGLVWVKFMFYHEGNITANNVLFQVYDGTTPIFKLENIWGTSDQFQAFYYNAVTPGWVGTGSSFFVADSSLTPITIKLDLPNGFYLYSGDTLIASGSGWSSVLSTVTNLRFSGYNNSTYFSEAIVGNYDLRGSRYKMLTMNGNSAANTGGAGIYTDVSETILDDTTVETVSVSGNKMGQTYSTVTLPANYTVGAVCMSARGLVTSGDGKLGLRTHTTNYSSAGKGYGGGFGPEGRIDMTNPNTGVDWTPTEINAIETYIEAS